MRTWVRAGKECRCGCCLRTIYFNQPMLEVTIPPLTQKFRRCPDCAGEPTPADLPDRTHEPRRSVQPLTTNSGMHPVQSIAHGLQLDWKQKASGE
mgnify:CR=1 FL=1